MSKSGRSGGTTEKVMPQMMPNDVKRQNWSRRDYGTDQILNDTMVGIDQKHAHDDKIVSRQKNKMRMG